MTKSTEEVGLVRSELQIPIAAPIEAVWKAMIDDISSWWDDGFYFTQKPRTIQLEAKIGGRLLETGANGDSLSWGEVIALQPGRTITMGGAFAPPYSGPAYSTLHLALEADGDEAHGVPTFAERVWPHPRGDEEVAPGGLEPAVRERPQGLRRKGALNEVPRDEAAGPGAGMVKTSISWNERFAPPQVAAMRRSLFSTAMT